MRLLPCDIVEWFAGSIRVGAVDRRRSGARCSNCRKFRGRYKAPRFAAGRARPDSQRADSLPAHALPGCAQRLERCQRGVVLVIPDDLDSGVRAVEEVVIRGRPGD